MINHQILKYVNVLMIPIYLKVQARNEEIIVVQVILIGPFGNKMPKKHRCKFVRDVNSSINLYLKKDYLLIFD